MTGQSDTNLAILEAIEDDDMEADYIQEIKGELLEAKPDDEEKNIDNEGKAFKRQPRKKTSTIWDHITTIKRNDGTLKNQCNYCKDLLAYNASGVTTHLWRHLKYCLQKQIADGDPDKKKQQILAFAEIDKEGVSSISNFSYDHAKVRELASHMVLTHEYPFEMMEHIIFNKFLKAISSFYQKISCYIVKKDCITTYENEKKRLKTVLKNVSRVSITTDLWKSGQKIQYMVVTGHFIDSNWMLHKCVLNFVNVPPPHTRVIVADALNKCLTEWGIENKVATITVDNAAYNDVCIRRLKDDFLLQKKLLLGGKLFHVRYYAHILNLLVQDGLSQIGNVIEVVREGIKYLNNSEARLNEFNKIRKLLQLPAKKLILDCPTRWNATYLMLAAALQFKDVFPRYKDIDPGFHYVPSFYDWMKVEEVCQFLGVFHEITNMISGFEYPTANIFLVELYRIKELLNEKSLDLSDHVRAMASSMAVKFDKYWAECNLVISLGAILDPRYKMVLIKFAFDMMYANGDVEKNVAIIKKALYDLYDEYVAAHNASHMAHEQREKQGYKLISSSTTDSHGIGRNIVTGKAKFESFIRKSDSVQPEKSELDNYLEENVFICEPNAPFDALEWWKANQLKYRILSKMAGDLLAIPITTVASEATFSAGGRVIDDRRASMSVDTVQMLLCASDWIRGLHGLKKHSRDFAEKVTFEEVVLPD